jgi:type I restriction-modification system DNA methylase subunit
MPNYSCEKCGRVFKQKSHFTDHQKKKKIDCSGTVIINEVIEKKVEQKVKEAIRVLNPYGELVLPENPEQKRAYLQSYFEAIHNLLWNRAGLNPERALEHLTFFFAYRLIEAQADTLNLPQECRWSTLASLKNENDTYETMKKGCVAFQKNRVTKPFFKKPEIEKADVIYEVIQQINRIPLKALQESDTLGDIFEYMLSRGMSTMSDEGQYFTNRAICKLAFKLTFDIKKSLHRSDGSLCTFADWFCGTGGFPAEYIKGVKEQLGSVDWKKESSAIYCQDMNISSITTTLLNLLILTGIPFSGEKIRSGNSFTDPIITGTSAPFKGLQIDYCFMNPPYGGDKTKGKEYKFTYAKKVKDDTGVAVKKFFVNEDIQKIGIEDDDKVSAGVQLAMATLSEEGGICAIVLPQGFFFGASRKVIELRKKLAEEYKIWYVVDIASGSFINTGTKTSMLVFQKGVGSTDCIKFIGLDEKVLVETKLADLRGKAYSLNYKQYLAQDITEVEGFTNVTLKDVCEFQRGTMITKASLCAGDIPVIGGGLSPMGYHNKSNRPANTILISQSGENAGYISRYPTEVWASDCFSIIAKDKMLNNSYLYYILKSIQDTIHSLKNGTAQPHVYPSTIEHLQIAVPSIETQQEIVEAIDGLMQLAHQEEQNLKLLEKQVMFEVKEMGKGKPRVKLGDVCEFKRGKMITKKDLVEGEYPVIGGGLTPMGFHNAFNHECYTPLISQSGENAGHISRYAKAVWASDCFSVSSKKMKNDMLYYTLLHIQEDINFLKTGTAQPHIYPSSIESLYISVPIESEQQRLQADFDEIRHKHEKIAYYKAKTQEAIKRLIPGA